MNFKNLSRRSSTSFGESTQGTLYRDTIQWVFPVLPQPLHLKTKGPTNSRGKPACRISFLDSTFIACGRKDPASWLKWRGRWRRVPSTPEPAQAQDQQPWDHVVSTLPLEWVNSMGYVEADSWDPSSLEGTSKVPDRLSQLGDHKPWIGYHWIKTRVSWRMGKGYFTCGETDAQHLGHLPKDTTAHGKIRIWTTGLIPKPQKRGQFISRPLSSWCSGGCRKGSPEKGYEIFAGFIHSIFLSQSLTSPLPHFLPNAQNKHDLRIKWDNS